MCIYAHVCVALLKASPLPYLHSNLIFLWQQMIWFSQEQGDIRASLEKQQQKERTQLRSLHASREDIKA